MAAAVFCAPPALAEGSRSLYPAGYEAAHTDEGRANLDLTGTGTVFLNVVPRRTFIYAYAQAGEYILVGSRNRTANGTGNILFYNPQSFGTKGFETIPGTADFACSTSTLGLIDTRAKELAGPQAISGGGNAAGYQPCFYQVPSTGIYGVSFGVGASGGAANGVVDPPAVSTSSVSAWDVTVRSSDTTSTADIDGRVFTYAWSSATGNNGVNQRLYFDLFYVTDDGYRYRQSLKGMDPLVGTFFANALGFRDQGQPLYKDIRGNNFAVNTGIAAGLTADNAQYPIFFSNVAAGGAPGIDATLAALSIPLVPKPPQVNSFTFTYPQASSSTSYVGQGGTFSFSVTDTISFQIIISRDGIDFDPATPANRVITGTSGTGSYSAVWDGKDNAGNNFPVGTNYPFRITGRNGEAHFPFVDVEGNLYGGPVVTKLNGNTVDSLVYFDDRGYVTAGGTAIGTLNGNICGNNTFPQPTPAFSLVGIDSSAKTYNNGSGPNSAFARWWPDGTNTSSDCAGAGQYFGDAKGLNLWTYQTTVPQASTFNIIDAADVRATISAPVSTDPAGGVTVNIGFGNVGSQSANSVTYATTLPAGLSNVACAGATCNYNSATGVVTISGLPSSLSAGQSVNVQLAYTAPASGSVSVVAAIGTSTSQGPNLAPDSASAATLVGGTNNADVLTTVTPPPSSVVGGTVTVPVTFANVGAASAAITGYGVQLPPGLANVACAGSGVACTYNSGTGAVTLTGLPASLAPGQSVPFTLTYTAPSAGTPVPVTSSIATSASESNTANNTATGTTTTQGIGAKPDVVASVAAPTTATPGSTVNVPITFGNVGDAAASGVAYSLTLPTGLSGVSCPAPAVCTYNSGTGAVAVTGLPATLAPGDQSNLTLRYTAPDSGVVPTTALIGTTTPGDANTANNSATSNTTVVTASSGADVTVTLTPPANSAPGAGVNVPITVANLGPADAAGLSYTVSLPPGLAGVSCSSSPAGVGCTYDAGTGAVTVTGLPVLLTSGQSVPFNLSYTAPASGQVPVNATISTSTFDPNSGNNAASGTTAIVASGGLADVTTSVSPPSSAVGGSVVNVPVAFSNVGTITAAAASYNIALTGSPTGVTVTNGAVPCTFNSGTGAVTGCGLPATLTPGQAVNLTVSYTAPATGAVGITSTVGTSTAESNTGNNTANASTSVSPAPAPDMGIDLSGLPATATAGTAYSGSFTCTNSGNAAATAGTSCSVSGLPAGVTQGACTISPSAAAWTAGASVPVGQTVTCPVSGTPTAAGTATIAGTTGATGDTATGNNTASKDVTVSPAGAGSTDVLTTVQPPPSAAAGATVTVPVSFANVGVSTVPITNYGLQLAPGLTGVACSGSGVSCSYDAGTGAVTLAGLPPSLTSGQGVPFSLVYTAPAPGTPVPVTSTITTSASEANTANNTATGTTTTVGGGNKPDVVASVAAPTTATPGSTVTVPVSFGNVGDTAASGISYGLTLQTGLAGVSCAAPAVCTYDSGTGAVTVTGLPETLTPGAFASLNLSFTAPASGVTATTATIGTTTPGETNTANNSATGKTTVVPAASGADVTVTLTVAAESAPGATVDVPVTVANLGPATAAGMVYTLGLPPGLTGVSCSPASVTCAYNAATGAVTLGGLPASLTSGQSVPFTLTYTAPPSAGQVPVNAAISTTTFDPNSGNNAASGTTVVGLPDVTASVSAPATAVSGSVVDVPVTFSNAGTITAAGVTYNVALTGSPTGVTVSNGAALCTYDSATGAITGCGLPATLTPGQSIDLIVSYTAPATGAVGISLAVGTTTGESNSGNNTASGSTALSPAAAPDMAINLSGLPATAAIGSPYNGSFACTNSGTAAATGATLCGVSGLPAGVAVGACSIGPTSAPWMPGSPVPAGQTVSCAVSGTPTTAGAFAISGTTGATGDVNSANNSASEVVAVGTAAPAKAQPIPTLSEWSLIVLSALMAAFGAGHALRRKRKA